MWPVVSPGGGSWAASESGGGCAGVHGWGGGWRPLWRGRERVGWTGRRRADAVARERRVPRTGSIVVGLRAGARRPGRRAAARLWGVSAGGHPHGVVRWGCSSRRCVCQRCGCGDRVWCTVACFAIPFLRGASYPSCVYHIWVLLVVFYFPLVSSLSSFSYHGCLLHTLPRGPPASMWAPRPAMILVFRRVPCLRPRAAAPFARPAALVASRTADRWAATRPPPDRRRSRGPTRRPRHARVRPTPRLPPGSPAPPHGVQQPPVRVSARCARPRCSRATPPNGQRLGGGRHGQAAAPAAHRQRSPAAARCWQ